MTDTGFLREVIEKNRWSITALADEIGITRQSLYSKMNGGTDFRASEIVKLSKVLKLTNAQRDRIFLSGKK